MTRTANIDVDGVLGEFHLDMAAEMTRTYGADRVRVPEPTDWDMTKCWQVHDVFRGEWRLLSTDEFWEVFEAGVLAERIFAHSEVVPEAREAVEALRAGGWRIRIVTNKAFRNETMKRRATISTVDWLHRNRIAYDDLVITAGGKTWATADAVVDDHPATTRWAQPGATNVLFGRRWNERFMQVDDAPVERVAGWRSVVGLLLG